MKPKSLAILLLLLLAKLGDMLERLETLYACGASVTVSDSAGGITSLLREMILDEAPFGPGMIAGDLTSRRQNIGSEVCVAPAAQQADSRTGAKEWRWSGEGRCWRRASR